MARIRELPEGVHDLACDCRVANGGGEHGVSMGLDVGGERGAGLGLGRIDTGVILRAAEAGNEVALLLGRQRPGAQQVRGKSRVERIGLAARAGEFALKDVERRRNFARGRCPPDGVETEGIGHLGPPGAVGGGVADAALAERAAFHGDTERRDQAFTREIRLGTREHVSAPGIATEQSPVRCGRRVEHTGRIAQADEFGQVGRLGRVLRGQRGEQERGAERGGVEPLGSEIGIRTLHLLRLDACDVHRRHAYRTLRQCRSG